MRTGGLIDRLENAGEQERDVAPGTARQLADVASALREVTERNARSMKIREAHKRAAKRLAPANDEEPALPQILQHPLSIADDAAAHQSGSRRGQVVAPAVLTIALILVAVLMSATFVDFSRVPGLSVLSDKPRPRLTGTSQPVVNLAASLDAAASTAAIGQLQIPPITLEELALLERCESLIATGDMHSARDVLAQAASAGSVNARFALAETFDPNVLAAWGMRERVADVGTARALYEQALAAGDQRAAARIAALKVESL